MDRIHFLEQLKLFTQDAVGDMLLPVKMQEHDDTLPPDRPADIFLMRLPDSKKAVKKAPYILHQVVTGKETRADATVTVRSIFCVYSNDEQQGGLYLLGLMERLRIALLRSRILDSMYRLDIDAGLETVCYPDDTAPYYVGEMVSVWKIPGIEMEVSQW